MGHYQHTDLAWHEGLPEWKPLSQFPEFALKHKTPNYRSVSYRQVSHKKESKAKNILTTLIFVLVAGAIGGGGYYYWKTKKEKKAEAERLAAEAAAAKTNSGDDFPKTIDALNRWYQEPPAGQNAAVLFQKGFEALQITDADAKSYTLPLFGKGTLPPMSSALPGGVKTTAADFLARNGAALGFFLQAAACSGSRYPFDASQGIASSMTHLANIRQAAQLGQLSAYVQADSGDGAAAGQGVLVTVAAGRSLEAEPTLFSQLVRLACLGIAEDTLEQVVNRVSLPPQTLTQLQSAFASAAECDAAGTGFDRALVGERVMSQATFKLPADQLRATISAGQTPPGVELGNLQDQQQFYEETLNQLIAARKAPMPDRLKADDTITPRISDAQSRSMVVVLAMIPSLVKVTAREGVSLARLRLAQTALALEQSRAATGSYPAALQDLTPQFVSAVPNDPFDNQPLRYRKAGEGYILYSIGPDAKDEGGVRRPGSDDLLFTVTRAPKP